MAGSAKGAGLAARGPARLVQAHQGVEDAERVPEGFGAAEREGWAVQALGAAYLRPRVGTQRLQERPIQRREIDVGRKASLVQAHPAGQARGAQMLVADAGEYEGAAVRAGLAQRPGDSRLGSGSDKQAVMLDEGRVQRLVAGFVEEAAAAPDAEQGEGLILAAAGHTKHGGTGEAFLRQAA